MINEILKLAQNDVTLNPNPKTINILIYIKMTQSVLENVNLTDGEEESLIKAADIIKAYYRSY